MVPPKFPGVGDHGLDTRVAVTGEPGKLYSIELSSFHSRGVFAGFLRRRLSAGGLRFLSHSAGYSSRSALWRAPFGAFTYTDYRRKRGSSQAERSFAVGSTVSYSTITVPAIPGWILRWQG